MFLSMSSRGEASSFDLPLAATREPTLRSDSFTEGGPGGADAPRGTAAARGAREGTMAGGALGSDAAAAFFLAGALRKPPFRPDMDFFAALASSAAFSRAETLRAARAEAIISSIRVGTAGEGGGKEGGAGAGATAAEEETEMFFRESIMGGGSSSSPESAPAEGGGGPTPEMGGGQSSSSSLSPSAETTSIKTFFDAGAAGAGAGAFAASRAFTGFGGAAGASNLVVIVGVFVGGVQLSFLGPL
jgi:hypothetical protein